MRESIPSSVQEWLRRLRKEGYTITNRRRHWLATHPEFGTLTIPRSLNGFGLYHLVSGKAREKRRTQRGVE